MKRIALPVEIKVRELNGKLWLAAHLALRGYKVAIGELTTLKQNLDIIKPNIYVGDGAYYKKSRKDLYKKLQNANVSVAIYDTEGIFKDYETRLSNDILKYVDCFLAWGQNSAEVFKKVVKNKKLRLFPVGNPAFDLLCEKNRFFYNSESEKLVEKYGDFVLINANFGWYNSYDPEKYVFPINSTFSGFYEFNKKMFYLFIDAIKHLSVNNENLKFVVRPHPAENFLRYGEIFNNYSNVIIEHSLSVHYWILAAKLSIHNACSTGAEAAMLERPVVAYQPVKNKEFDDFIANIVSLKAESLADLQDLIDLYCHDKTNDGYKLSKRNRTLLEKGLYRLDGKAAERVCDAFDSLKINYNNQIGNINKATFYENILNKCKSFKRFIKSVVSGGEKTVNNRGADLYVKQKYPETNEQELQELLDRFVLLNSGFKNVVIKPVDGTKDIYWIEKKRVVLY